MSDRISTQIQKDSKWGLDVAFTTIEFMGYQIVVENTVNPDMAYSRIRVFHAGEDISVQVSRYVGSTSLDLLQTMERLRAFKQVRLAEPA